MAQLVRARRFCTDGGSIRHLKGRSTIVTTNKPLAALGYVLHDADLAEAILDRLLERGAHYVLRGRSYRTRHLKREVDLHTGDTPYSGPASDKV